MSLWPLQAVALQTVVFKLYVGLLSLSIFRLQSCLLKIFRSELSIRIVHT